MELFWRDVQHALKSLASSPRFTILALLSLAAGIGLNTAVFSFTNAVLLRPFPYKEPDRLVLIWGTTSLDVRRGINGHEVEVWKSQTRDFEDISVFQLNPLPFTFGSDDTDSVQGALVAPNLFSVLGAQPLLGRSFTDIGDDPGPAVPVVISFGLWHSRFGADPSIIGRAVLLNREIHTVTGVMPKEFFFPDQYVQLWLPLTRSSAAFDQVHALGRLRAFVTIPQAQAELDALSTNTQALSPTHLGIHPGVFSLYHVIVGKYETALWTLLGSVTLLQILACLNVSTMLLTRGVRREKEFAVRAACGASPRRMVQMLLVESFVLSIAAWLAGIVCAELLFSGLYRLNLVEVPRLESASMNLRVLAFGLGISLATIALSGVLPAWKSAHPDVNATLQIGGLSTHPRSHAKIRNLLVTIEVSLAIVLMIGAGLLIRSFVQLAHVNWGFEADSVLLLEVELPPEIRQHATARIDLLEQITDRLASLPFVRSTAVAYGVPIRYYWQQTHLAVDGTFVNADWVAGTWTVGPRYFKTLNVPILRGKEFDEQNYPSNDRSVIVSKDLAEKLWRGSDPIGKQVQILRLRSDLQDKLRNSSDFLVDPETWRAEKSWEPDGPPLEVIGEVGNVRMFGLETGTDTFAPLYVDYRRNTGFPPPVFRLVVNTSIEPLEALPAVKAEIEEVNHATRIKFAESMRDLMARSIAGRGSTKLLMLVAVLFGALSFLLAALGVYGVTAYSTAERWREIGIRAVLGAQPGNILRMLILDGLRPIAFGVALGLVITVGTARLVSSVLFGVGPGDIATYVVALALLCSASVAACIIPAIRVLRINPIESVRHE